ncbi:MAG: hypothetical protein R3Y29_06245 [bacterium]
MYSVIDIGSNTVRLVGYQVQEDNNIQAVINKKYNVGLASYIIAENKNNIKDDNNPYNTYLSEEGIQKLTDTLLEFRDLLKYINLKEVYPFATASLRNISNSKEVLDLVKQKTDFDIELLSGEEEAIYDYFGMTRSLNNDTGIMVDIGGGSTELVFFKNKTTILEYSLPIGSLNLYNNFVQDIIPTPAEVVQIQKEVKRNLNLINIPANIKNIKNINKELDIKLSDFNTICGVGGTARAVSKIINRKKKNKNEGYLVSDINKLVDRILADNTNISSNTSISPSQNKKLVEQVLKICPDRIHTIMPGFIALDTIAKEYNVNNIVTSQYGVREGFLYAKLKQGGALNE